MEFEKSEVKKYPFQVIHATNCLRTTDNSAITDEMLLSTNQLKIKNGHLILVHYSGKFLEFVNDTTINLETINSGLLRRITNSNNRYRPNIDFINSDKVHGGVSDGVSGIVPLNDSPMAVDINEEFCLRWTLRGFNNDPNKFIVTIRNIFNETLQEIETDTKTIIIDLNEYYENLFIIEIKDKDSTMSSGEIGLKKGKGDFILPTYCEPETSIEALELAFHLERKYFGRHEALRYYELADELSEQPFYNDQLEKYKLRNLIK